MNKIKAIFQKRKRFRALSDEYRILYVKLTRSLKFDVQPSKKRQDALDELLSVFEESVANNVGVEELLPQGYETFYQDLVDSLPCYTSETKKRRNIKNRVLLCVTSLLLTTVVLFGILIGSGILGVATDGISYIAENMNDYSYSYQKIDSAFEFSIDLKNPSKNIGKIVYQAEGCYIEISEIQVNDNNAIVYFRTHGEYSRKSATLVSAIKHSSTPSHYFTYQNVATFENKYNGKSYICDLAGMSGLNHKDGDSFGYYLFPEEFFENEKNSIENITSVPVAISNLVINNWILK